jgi:hypothetical protein
MATGELSKHDHILAGLVFSLQAAAMQQMGKIQNPMNGEIDKDLDQAKGTIDILDMLKAKCRTDTPEDLLRMIDSAVMDLQLNYTDEVKKAAAAGSAEETENAEEPVAEEPAEENTDKADG